MMLKSLMIPIPLNSRYLKKATAIHLQRSFGLWAETAYQNVVRKLYGAKYGDESLTDFEFAYDEFGEEAIELLKVVGLSISRSFCPSIKWGGKTETYNGQTTS